MLEWDAPKRIQWVPTPRGVPADARRAVPVRVAIFTEAGEPDTGANPKLSTNIGKISAPEYEGDGIYSAQFTPPNGGSVEQVTLTAEIGEEKGQMDASI